MRSPMAAVRLLGLNAKPDLPTSTSWVLPEVVGVGEAEVDDGEEEAEEEDAEDGEPYWA